MINELIAACEITLVAFPAIKTLGYVLFGDKHYEARVRERCRVSIEEAQVSAEELADRLYQKAMSNMEGMKLNSPTVTTQAPSFSAKVKDIITNDLAVKSEKVLEAQKNLKNMLDKLSTGEDTFSDSESEGLMGDEVSEQIFEDPTR